MEDLPGSKSLISFCSCSSLSKPPLHRPFAVFYYSPKHLESHVLGQPEEFWKWPIQQPLSPSYVAHHSLWRTMTNQNALHPISILRETATTSILLPHQLASRCSARVQLLRCGTGLTDRYCLVAICPVHKPSRGECPILDVGEG